MNRQPGKFAVVFVFVTVFIDMVGFGLIMPVLPRLIEEVSGSGLANASIWGGWLFFAPEALITRLIGVLDAEPQVFQVGVNFGDASTLIGRCAEESQVRRARGAGRYVLTNTVINGPAMFEVDRSDHVLNTWRPGNPVQTATLDEVLCMAQ